MFEANIQRFLVKSSMKSMDFGYTEAPEKRYRL